MIKPPTKKERVLETLLESPLNHFQAEQIGDHALPFNCCHPGKDRRQHIKAQDHCPKPFWCRPLL